MMLLASGLALAQTSPVPLRRLAPAAEPIPTPDKYPFTEMISALDGPSGVQSASRRSNYPARMLHELVGCEGDEPRFTQPLLYKAIEKHPNPREIYSQKLIEHGDVGAEIAKEMEADFRNMLQERLDESKQIRKTKITSFYFFFF